METEIYNIGGNVLEKKVLSAASSYNKKYYFNNEFDKLPETIKSDIKVITICIAEKTHGIFNVGFYNDGSIYFESLGQSDDFNYDEIGAKLEISKLENKEKQLINSLSLWYKVVFKNNQERAAK